MRHEAKSHTLFRQEMTDLPITVLSNRITDAEQILKVQLQKLAKANYKAASNADELSLKEQRRAKARVAKAKEALRVANESLNPQTLDPVAQAMVRTAALVQADVLQLMTRAVTGTVRDAVGSKGKAEWEFPLNGSMTEVGELRHPNKGHIDTWQYRLYFGAPGTPHLQTVIVFVRLGHKQTSIVSTDWDKIQTSDIACARDRYAKWLDEQ